MLIALQAEERQLKERPVEEERPFRAAKGLSKTSGF